MSWLSPRGTAKPRASRAGSLLSMRPADPARSLLLLRRRAGLGSRLRLLLHVGEQLLEVVPLSQRVEPGVGPQDVRFVESCGRGLAQQVHRLVGFGPAGGRRYPRAVLPGQPRLRGPAAGQLEEIAPALEILDTFVEKLDGPAVGGGRLGEPARRRFQKRETS